MDTQKDAEKAKKSTKGTTKDAKDTSNTQDSDKETPKQTIQAEVVREKKTDSDSSNSQSQSGINIDNKTMILLAHILGLVTSFIASLVIYLISEDALVKKHAAAALNFQISLIIYGVVLTVVGGILTVVTFGLFALILFPAYFALMIYAIVPPIIATIQANKDDKQVYKYPLVLELIS